MTKIRNGFFKSAAFMKSTERFRDAARSNGPTDDVLETFGRWCIENGVSGIAESIVFNMKSTLHERLKRPAKSKKARELERQMIACLCKATDELFDQANKNSGCDTAEEIVEAIRFVYEERYNMILW